MAVRAFAPAKVNLYLHVIGRRADGYHQLDSLIAFADIGDRLVAAPAAALSLDIGGPHAADLGEPAESNLVLRAARRLAEAAGIAPTAALYLEKNLPVAAGIGGGSSDAAATLAALTRLWRLPFDRASLARIGGELGADVPVCIYRRPAWVSGIGERVEPTAGLPPAGIVLANPRRPLPTAAVFAARGGPFSAPDRFDAMPNDAAGLTAALSRRRNDLSGPATSLVPEISAVLDRLSRLPGALIARLSGSGATCFALFADRAAARRAATVLTACEPGWWIAAGRLSGGRQPPGNAAKRRGGLARPAE